MPYLRFLDPVCVPLGRQASWVSVVITWNPREFGLAPSFQNTQNNIRQIHIC